MASQWGLTIIAWWKVRSTIFIYLWLLWYYSTLMNNDNTNFLTFCVHNILFCSALESSALWNLISLNHFPFCHKTRKFCLWNFLIKSSKINYYSILREKRDYLNVWRQTLGKLLQISPTFKDIIIFVSFLKRRC